MRLTIIFLLGLGLGWWARAAAFTISSDLFNHSRPGDLGLATLPGTTTTTVYQPSATGDKFSNGAVAVSFKGKLLVQWQSSVQHEDSPDTWVAYSTSDDDGATWSAPQVLAASPADGYVSSGGWWVQGDTLIAFINYWPSSVSPRGGFAQFTTSTDGINWSPRQSVLMADDTPLAGIFEQDPHALPSGRIVNSAHFQPGLIINPIYTDDPSGVRGWHKSTYTNLPHTGDVSREIESSWFRQSNGHLVMVFRDQNSSFRQLTALSTDNGSSFSTPELSSMPDSRSKQSAGNLPDGVAYMVNNPSLDKNRYPLALTLSRDGAYFDKSFLLRSQDELPPRQYEGNAKTLGYSYPKSTIHGDYLIVAYTTNKELVQITQIPLASICAELGNCPTVKVLRPGSIHFLPASTQFDLLGRSK